MSINSAPISNAPPLTNQMNRQLNRIKFNSIEWSGVCVCVSLPLLLILCITTIDTS